MTISDFQKSIIALSAWRAAPYDRHQIPLYVIMVFRNRAAQGWYEGDLYENCWHWLQENPGEFPDTRNPEFQLLLDKIDGVITGLVPDKTGGALYFAHKQDAEQITGTRTCEVGQMWFIK